MSERTPFLRYPLWRFTAVVIVASTAVSGLILWKLRRNENMRRKKWEEFFKYGFIQLLYGALLSSCSFFCNSKNFYAAVGQDYLVVNHRVFLSLRSVMFCFLAVKVLYLKFQVVFNFARFIYLLIAGITMFTNM